MEKNYLIAVIIAVAVLVDIALLFTSKKQAGFITLLMAALLTALVITRKGKLRRFVLRKSAGWKK